MVLQKMYQMSNKNRQLDFLNYNMKQTIIFIYELVKFILISLPLAFTILFTANVIYELKRIINGIRFRTKRIRELY
jgi:nucleoside diphosphate kinase